MKAQKEAKDATQDIDTLRARLEGRPRSAGTFFFEVICNGTVCKGICILQYYEVVALIFTTFCDILHGLVNTKTVNSQKSFMD